MLKRTYTISMVAGALALAFGLALAAEPAATQQPVKEELYGSQLMTQQERAAHRAKMRAATTPEAKAQIRAAQHDRMKQRARQLGLELPETPPAVGGGMGVVSGECKAMAPCGGSNR